MVVNSVRNLLPTSAVPENIIGSPPGSIDRQILSFRPYPFFYTMYSPNPNPYTPIDPSSFGSDSGPPYSVYSAADTSHGYGSKFGPSPSGFGFGATSGHGSSYGPPAPSSGGYDYHPTHPHPHPYPPPHPIPFHFPSPKPGKKGKGAALSALTLLAFLYFLNLLQSCLKEHMETMNPTVSNRGL